MNRTTSIVFLLLFLVTTAGSLLPLTGGLPGIGDQNVAVADIEDSNTYPFGKKVMARNLILGETIRVCGELETDAKVAINDMNSTLIGQGIVTHNVFIWASICPTGDKDEDEKLGYVEIVFFDQPSTACTKGTSADCFTGRHIGSPLYTSCAWARCTWIGRSIRGRGRTDSPP